MVLRFSIVLYNKNNYKNMTNEVAFFFLCVFYFLVKNSKNVQKTSKNQKTCFLYKSNVNFDERMSEWRSGCVLAYEAKGAGFDTRPMLFLFAQNLKIDFYDAG